MAGGLPFAEVRCAGRVTALGRSRTAVLAAVLLIALLMTRSSAGQVISAPVVTPAVPVAQAGAQAVTLVPSTVALQITTPLTVFYGEAIDGLAQVTAQDGSTVTGTVAFYDGATAFCTLGLTNGAACPVGVSTGFAAGTHAFTAVYSGDATHAGATSNAVPVEVKQDTTETMLTSALDPVTAGGNVVYLVQVQGAHGPVAGAVELFDGSVSVGRAVVDANGRATLAVLMVAPGTHTMKAVYAGNANSAGSTSGLLDEIVVSPLAASATTISASANPATAGDTVVLKAQVIGGTSAPTGTVTFVDGGTVLGSAAVNGTGVAAWSSTSLSVGAHAIVARYGGDAATTGSASAVLNEVVNAAPVQPGDGFALGESVVTIAAGFTAVVPVETAAGSSFANAMSVSCSGLPNQASCSFGGGGVLKIVTAGPRDCGTSTPYGVAGVPLTGPVLAGLLVFLVPRRRRWKKGLLMAACALVAMGAMTGCGTGNCTDLGTMPGTYVVTVTGSSGGAAVSQKVTLVVTP